MNKKPLKSHKVNSHATKFLDRCQEYGFQEPSEVVITALPESATLYAEIYENDGELQELTEAGLEEWLKE
jgi:hypothetical protein